MPILGGDAQCLTRTRDAWVDYEGLPAFLGDCEGNGLFKALLGTGKGLAGEWTGGFYIRKGGAYQFSVPATDGGIMWVDGSRVATGGDWGSLVIAKGYHSLKIRWYADVASLSTAKLSALFKGEILCQPYILLISSTENCHDFLSCCALSQRQGSVHEHPWCMRESSVHRLEAQSPP